MKPHMPVGSASFEMTATGSLYSISASSTLQRTSSQGLSAYWISLRSGDANDGNMGHLVLILESSLHLVPRKLLKLRHSAR